MYSTKLRNLVSPDFLKDNHRSIFTALLVFFLFPLCFISQYNFPSSDDFDIFLQAQKLGTIEATKYWYFNWTGRYSSFFLQSFLAANTDWLLAYKVIPMLLFIFEFGILFYFLKSFFGWCASDKVLFSFTACLFIFLISVTPDITTGFYWLPSGFQYVGAVFLTLLILALLNGINSAASLSVKIGIFVVIAFLTAFLAGLNEISILFLIMILCFINLCYFQKHKKIYVWGLMILALGIASGAIALLAPGNTVRAVRGGTAVALTAQRMAEILLGSVAVTFYLLVEIFATTPILIVSLLYFAFLNANRDKFEKGFLVLESVPWKWVIVFLLGSTTFINIAVFKAIGVNSLTHRVQNVYVYNIILTWFFLITVFVANQRKRNFQNLFSKPAITFLTVFVFLFLLFGFELKFSKLDIAPDSNALQKAFSTIKTGSTYTNAYLDILSGRATRFERVNQERLSRIRETTASTVELPLYSFVPKTLFAQDVNHPLGYPERMIESFSGEIKPYKYTETGPPVPLKEKF